MANNSEIRLPDGSVVSGNWATEETLAGVKLILEKIHGKKGAIGNVNTQEAKDTKKKLAINSKYYKQREQLRRQSAKSEEAHRKEREKNYPKVIEGLKILGDTSRIAGRGIGKITSSTSALVDEMDKLDGSVSGASNAFFKVVGSAGAIGTAFGVAAGIIDQFAEFQTQAIQTGFSFSQELINTRGNIAELGMNMKQLSDILITNGEAVRSLGGNGAQSANAFIDLVSRIKEASHNFGLFGMTSEEIAGQTAARLDLMRRQGFVGDVAANATAESFSTLNQEIMAYSRMTGRERREIMRNNISMREDSALLVGDLATLGPNASGAFDGFTNAISAVFGDIGGDAIDSIFTNMIESQLSGLQRVTQEQYQALAAVPGLGEVLTTAVEELIANVDNPDALLRAQLAFSNSAGEIIQGAIENDGLIRLTRMMEDNPAGEILRAIVSAGQSATIFLETSNAEQVAAFAATMSVSEANLLRMRDRIQVLQNSFSATLIQALGFGQLEDMLSDDNFAAAQLAISEFGTNLSSIREFVADFAELVTSDGGGSLSSALVVGIAAMFAAQGLVSLAMVAGIRGLFAIASSVLGVRTLASSAVAPAAAASAVAPASAGSRVTATGARVAAGASKKLPAIGTAISALFGILDSEYQEADYNILSRGILGVTEGILAFGDFMSDSVVDAIHGPGHDNYLELGQGFRDLMLADSAPIPAFNPSDQRVSTGNMVIPGATLQPNGSMETGIRDDNAFRHNVTNEELMRRLVRATEETTRLQRRLLDNTDD
jgi:hypothetical protein